MSNIISLNNNTQIYIVLDKLDDKMKMGGYRGLKSCAQLVIKTVSDGMLKTAKTGIKYSGMRLRSSTAGEYPANQTGNLRRGLGFQLQSTSKVYVGNRVHYSRYVAHGTKRMRARKFIREAIGENLDKLYNTVSQAINREVRV